MRLIIFILIFAIFLCFIIFNLPYKSDVNLGFTSFTDIPIFITALTSFILGMIVSVPLVFLFRRGKKQPAVPKVSKKQLKKQNEIAAQDTIKKEDSPYGID